MQPPDSLGTWEPTAPAPTVAPHVPKERASAIAIARPGELGEPMSNEPPGSRAEAAARAASSPEGAPSDAGAPPGPEPRSGLGDRSGLEHQSGLEPQSEAERERIWSELQAALRRRVKREQFETWFRRATLRRVDARSVCIAVQNTFARDWLQSNYRAALEESVAEVCAGRRAVEFVVDAELACRPAVSEGGAGAADAGEGAGAGTAAVVPSAGQDSMGPAGRAMRKPGGQLARGADRRRADPLDASSNRLLWASDVALNPNYRFDNFVVGPCNRFAHAAALGVSESPGIPYNPFFLHGSVGLGKTHLLQSLCFALLERTPDTRILYLSCETFINHFIGALENGDLQKFRNKYRNVDVLVVDDIHMLANKERTQEEFFHTFNTLYNAGKQIVLSSDSSPKEIPKLQERLVSRFKWGLVTEIEPPCYETRMAILKRKSKERGHELPEDVARLLAEHVDTNIRELEGAVTRVIGYATLSGQSITADLARRLLRDVFSSPRGQPSMEDILRVVTAHFGVKVTDLQSKKRTNAIALPRQVGMYLARKITRHSLEEIGGFFGGRDHSTVLYAVDKIDRESRQDERFRELIATFLGQLQRST
jgi:chromosomal replication initiator protein